MIKLICTSSEIPKEMETMFRSYVYGITNCSIHNLPERHTNETNIILSYYELQGEPIKTYFEYAKEHDLKFNISINGFYSCAGLNSSFIYLENLQMDKLIQTSDKSENTFRMYDVVFKFGKDKILKEQISQDALKLLGLNEPYIEKGEE